MKPGASSASPHRSTRLQLLRGSVAFFPALIEAIHQAEQEVYLETYLFNPHGSAHDVALALERAAYRGVKVCLLVDGVGTGSIPAPWAERFDQAGVTWRVYSPVNFFAAWQPNRWRRLHRKLCVVDAQIAFCGGINLLDDFFDPHANAWIKQPRLDFALRVEGDLVSDIHATVKTLWDRLDNRRMLSKPHINATLQKWFSADAQPAPPHSRHQTHLVLRDNLRHRVQIERAYRKAIGSAHHEVVLACAFFFPGLRLLRALVEAAKRGVRVRLLLQGHYEYWIPYRAARQLYGQLLAAGVEIYEYQASFLHAKVAVVDQHWLTVGSSNLDPLSLLMAREANIVTQDSALAAELHQYLCVAIEQGAVRVEPHQYLQRAWYERLEDVFAAAMLRFGVFLTGKRY